MVIKKPLYPLCVKGSKIFAFDTFDIFSCNEKYWEELRANNYQQYKHEKQSIAKELLLTLEQKYSGITDAVEVTDVSTPATVRRYTNNWRGSLDGWIMSPEVGFKAMAKTLPKLQNFYMAGQWVEPGGGLPPALTSGREVAQLICRQDKREFRTF